MFWYRVLAVFLFTPLFSDAFAQSPAVRVARAATDVPAIDFAKLPASQGGGFFITIEGGLVAVSDLAEALRAGEIRNVNLLRCRVSPETTTKLKSIASLKSFNANRCSFSEGGLAIVLSNKNIESLRLDLGENSLTDDEAKAIADLDNLKELTLIGTGISDAGIVGLNRLRNIKSITIESNQVTSRGIAAVSSMLKNCNSIILRCPRVDDGIVPVISKLKATDELLLNETSVSDACIPEIEKLKRLRYLGLPSPKVSPAGAARLRSSLPSLNLIYEE